MQWIAQRYRGLPARDRGLIGILMFFSALALYLFLAGALWKELSSARTALKGDRYDYNKLLETINTPEMASNITEERLDALQQEQRLYEARLRELSQRLLPLDESGPREHLKLELTRLAEKEKLQVIRIHTEGTELHRLPEILEGESLHRYLQERPVLTLNMTGHYFDLVAFLDDLQALSWQVRIGDMAIESRSDSGELDIQLELKL